MNWTGEEENWHISYKIKYLYYHEMRGFGAYRWLLCANRRSSAVVLSSAFDYPRLRIKYDIESFKFLLKNLQNIDIFNIYQLNHWWKTFHFNGLTRSSSKRNAILLVQPNKLNRKLEGDKYSIKIWFISSRDMLICLSSLVFLGKSIVKGLWCGH